MQGEALMRTVAVMLGGGCALLSVFGSGLSANAADVPSYFKEIVGSQTASPAEIGTKNIPATQHDDVRTLRQCRTDFPQEHPGPTSAHPGTVLGGRRAIHPLSSGDGAARG